MLAGDDNRLCTNYCACKNYQASYRAGTDTCSGCQGDISAHRTVTKVVDKHIDKLAGMVHQNTPETFAQAQVDAWMGAKRELEESIGEEVTANEVIVLFASRSMQRLCTLEEAVKAALR